MVTNWAMGVDTDSAGPTPGGSSAPGLTGPGLRAAAVQESRLQVGKPGRAGVGIMVARSLVTSASAGTLREAGGRPRPGGDDGYLQSETCSFWKELLSDE